MMSAHESPSTGRPLPHTCLETHLEDQHCIFCYYILHAHALFMRYRYLNYRFILHACALPTTTCMIKPQVDGQQRSGSYRLVLFSR
jgi:hypothetical protein